MSTPALLVYFSWWRNMGKFDIVSILRYVLLYWMLLWLNQYLSALYSSIFWNILDRSDIRLDTPERKLTPKISLKCTQICIRSPYGVHLVATILWAILLNEEQNTEGNHQLFWIRQSNHTMKCDYMCDTCVVFRNITYVIHTPVIQSWKPSLYFRNALWANEHLQIFIGPNLKTCRVLHCTDQ